MQPRPTVPDPITSPGRRPGVLRAAADSSCSHEKYIPPVDESVLTSPLTRETARISSSAGSSSGETSTGPSEVAKSLPFAGPSPTAHLPRLEVAGGPVVHDREPLRPAVRTDHARQLELVVERVGVGGFGTSSPSRYTADGFEK